MMRLGRHMLGAAFTAALAPAPLAAQDCANPVTQLDMNFCAQHAWQQADAELNHVWSIVKPQADQSGLGQLLLDAQRAWLAYRDATCHFEQSVYAGGSIAPLIFHNCMERLTRTRSEELQGGMN